WQTRRRAFDFLQSISRWSLRDDHALREELDASEREFRRALIQGDSRDRQEAFWALRGLENDRDSGASPELRAVLMRRAKEADREGIARALEERARRDRPHVP